MNLLLLDPEEFDPEEFDAEKFDAKEVGQGHVILRGRRAEHLREIIDVVAGQTLRAGILNGPLGTATVVSRGDDAIELSCVFEDEAPPPPRDTLLLAVPRPPVLARCLEQATALGFGTILLHRTWSVEKSLLKSRMFRGNKIEQHLRLGLEQSRRTHLPRVLLFDRFKSFVEDQVDRLAPEGQRFVAHPDDAKDTRELQLADAPFTLAIGPEGGYIPFEIELLQDRGFTVIRPTPHILKVETALAVCQAQLDILR